MLSRLRPALVRCRPPLAHFPAVHRRPALDFGTRVTRATDAAALDAYSRTVVGVVDKIGDAVVAINVPAAGGSGYVELTRCRLAVASCETSLRVCSRTSITLTASLRVSHLAGLAELALG